VENSEENKKKGVRTISLPNNFPHHFETSMFTMKKALLSRETFKLSTYRTRRRTAQKG
jgi:hypothetical protein